MCIGVVITDYSYTAGLVNPVKWLDEIPNLNKEEETERISKYKLSFIYVYINIYIERK